ncbi:MAG: CCA tRNA nucleotidyltransferase [Elusimicrobia bacterium]|nr:CCA tRNA nucleotidyltransferase [Elusimicrobiota bacterium]
MPKKAERLLRLLGAEAARRGLPIYLVGGCVRDWLLGRRTLDLDFAVEGDPAPMALSCGRFLGVEPQAFGQFGTQRVVSRELRADFAMTRGESYPEPASLPVVKPAALREDLFRRDFTINAMAAPLSERGLGGIIDPYLGIEDLKSRTIRILHPASFRDDPTRVFRAARFLCRFSFRPAAGSVELARAALEQGHAARLSRHRLAQELLRVLEERSPSCALEKLRSWGYLQLIHPRLRWREMPFREAGPRLAALALGLGPEEGQALIRSLPIERALARAILEIVELPRRRASPQSRLQPWAARVLARSCRGIGAGSLRPRFLGGDDLKELGLVPGKAYGEILEEAARRQWRGQFKNRGQALRWLAARAKKSKSA